MHALAEHGGQVSRRSGIRHVRIGTRGFPQGLQHLAGSIKPQRLRQLGIVVEKSAELDHGTMLAGHSHVSKTQKAPQVRGGLLKR